VHLARQPDDFQLTEKRLYHNSNPPHYAKYCNSRLLDSSVPDPQLG